MALAGVEDTGGEDRVDGNGEVALEGQEGAFGGHVRC